MSFALQFISVFISMVLTDIAWTVYFIKVEERRPIASGVWSALIMVFGAFVTSSYVGDKRLMAAAILGAFVGTSLTVWYKKKKQK